MRGRFLFVRDLMDMCGMLNHTAYIKTQLPMCANDKKLLKFQGSWDIISLADVFEKYRQKRNERVVFIIRSAFVWKSFA